MIEFGGTMMERRSGGAIIEVGGTMMDFMALDRLKNKAGRMKIIFGLVK